jgi:hypothetical protein
MYKLQDFTTSSMLAAQLLKKFCSLRDEIQNRFFEIAVMTALVDERPDAAERVIEESSGCLKTKETREEALSQIYEFHEKHGDFFNLRLFFKRHPSLAFKERYHQTLQKWYWEKLDLNLKEQIKVEFKDLKSSDALVWINEIKKFEAAQKEAGEIKAFEVWSNAPFDPKAFNQSVEGYLQRVKVFKEKYQLLLTCSQVELSILAAQLFSDLFLTVGEKIKALNPVGLEESILMQVKTAMGNLSIPFISASRQYQSNITRALSSKENLISGVRSVSSLDGVENPTFSFFTGLTMDRGLE